MSYQNIDILIVLVYVIKLENLSKLVKKSELK